MNVRKLGTLHPVALCDTKMVSTKIIDFISANNILFIKSNNSLFTIKHIILLF